MCATGREAMRIIRHVILGSLIFVLSCAPAASAASQTRSAQSHALVPPESSTIGGPIAINDLATTSSSITVSAGNRLVVDVDVWVKFNGHTEPDDVHLALKSPAGSIVPIMGDRCGSTAFTAGVEYYFDDEAATVQPDAGPCPTGTYRPAGVPAKWQQASAGTRLDAFNGTAASGTWTLFAYDDLAQDTGSIASWRISVDTPGLSNDGWAGAAAFNAAGTAMPSPFQIAGVHTNQSATLETLPGGIDERSLQCNGFSIGKSVWYEFHLPGAGALDLVAQYRDDTDTVFDWDWSRLDASLMVFSFDPATGRVIDRVGCSDSESAGGAERITTHLAAGSYRIMLAGARAIDNGAQTSNASDGLFVLGGTFTADPPPPPPPPADTDGDGITDNLDQCPAVSAAPPDADRNGCTDIVAVTPVKRIVADVKYKWGKWRRDGRLRGAALKVVRIEDLPRGAKVRATCRGCQLFRRGRARKFRTYSTTARRTGDLRVKQLTNTLVPRRKKLVVVITRPGEVGRRVEIRMGTREPSKSRVCLAVGSRTARVACVVDS